MVNDQAYQELVARRRVCSICKDLINPSMVAGGKFDSGEIGPWTRWQGRLDANLMVVGQDFSSQDYFRKWKGRDQPDSPTNRNLIKLLASIGVSLAEPNQGNDRGEAFFTNAILCLKKGNMQSQVRKEWFENCGSRFLRLQIELVSPRVVVGLGERAHNAVLGAFGLPEQTLRRAISSSGTQLPDGSVLVAVYHCGARVVNISRSLGQQMEDWRRVGAILNASAA